MLMISQNVSRTKEVFLNCTSLSTAQLFILITSKKSQFSAVSDRIKYNNSADSPLQ